MQITVRAPAPGLILAGFLATALPVTTLAANSLSGEAPTRLLAGELASGRISEETYLLEVFRYVFAPEKMDPRYRPEELAPLKCFTEDVARFAESRGRLSERAVAEIDGYLRPQYPTLRATYISPSGLFELTYDTSGTNAPPQTDVNPANGIPDFVERCAEYLDTSWNVEITNLGFTAPLLPGDGSYDVGFQNMGAYGFTSIVGPGLTEITLENNFQPGFPPNSDPDGDQLGAAKATCAHEFKHASQYTNNGWSEGGWVELDATWVEDIVFDLTNDYYNYINLGFSNSQLSDPWLSLDNGGTGSYEDCLWQHYLSENWGNQFIVDLWERRDLIPSENMKTSYGQVLQAYGSSWNLAWPEMYEWCWFTGGRAEPPFGFGEASSYRQMDLRTNNQPVNTYPYVRAEMIDPLSAHPYRFNAGTAGNQAQIVFNGNDAHPGFTVSVIVEQPEITGLYTIVRPALDGVNDFTYLVPLPWESIQYAGVIVTNSQRTGTPVDYTINVNQVPAATDAAIAVSGAAPTLALKAATPNPFATSTRIAFAMPHETRAVLRILDVTGRTVRVLHDGLLPAGEGDILWDGRNEAGQIVPAGVYWSRIETNAGSVARRIVAVR